MKQKGVIISSLLVLGISLSFTGCGGSGSSGNSSNSSSSKTKVGTLDLDFANTGYVANNNAAGGNSADRGESIALDSNGNIYVAGYSRNSSSNNDMVIWKYKSDGTLDKTFGTKGNGIVTHNSAAGGNGFDMGYSIALDSSGNIYVTGTSMSTSTNYDMVIWKYKSDGKIDTAFGTNGIVKHNGNGPDYGQSIALDSRGSIYVTGYSFNTSNNSNNKDMAIWKYQSNGGTFELAVTRNRVGDDEGLSIAKDSSGNTYVAGYIRGSSSEDMAIWKYKSNDTIDTTFGTNGIVTHDGAAGATNSTDKGHSIALDSNGNIYVTGESGDASSSDMVIWKYDKDGKLDTNFGTNGIVKHKGTAGGTGKDVGKSIALDSSGNIYVTGLSNNGSNNDMVIWKYTSSGKLDTSFGSSGIIVHDKAAGGTGNDVGNSIVLDSTNNKIYVTGYSYNGTNLDMALWKYK